MENTLEFLLGQAQECEKDAVLSLSKARNELEDYYVQLSQIEQYRLDYCAQLVQRGMDGLTASQYSHLNRFLTQLDETLKKQKEAEEHFKNQVDNCESHWLEMRKQRRSYQWLIEKRQKEKSQQIERQEQKQLDEFSTIMYARRTIQASKR
ncbi:flagella biosynthesis chaperone FliJ [Vibrio sp. S4M6]|uniref:flagellar export protein FliJ n=1 Tax=Vibrio sinus TaxID=2946865 RepID=UPI00202AC14F|nr:flagellar export protein FliJ [Vibrio sinus]MCL9781888.1 flagella biosynthesis chaperone FliJ [Vibrio sinus]